ncbi:MAG: hypothetical protein IMZ61_05610 [Planctomycetes bacterium]|nr:hypothetical protein [Planctomycetota bacterium]
MPDRSPAYFHQHPDIQSPAVSRFFGNRSPNETITDTHPPYNWNSSSGATSYRLAVWSNASASYVIDTDVASSYCTGGVCTYTRPLCLLMATTASRCWLRTQSAPAPTAPGWISP